MVALDDGAEPEDPRPGPERALEAAWARRVLEQAVGLMRGQCEGNGKAAVWEMFQARVLGPAAGGGEPVPYDQLVSRLRLDSPAQASNLLVTAKRTFIRCLRQVVAEYESDEQLIDEEVAELRRALGGK